MLADQNTFTERKNTAGQIQGQYNLEIAIKAGFFPSIHSRTTHDTLPTPNH